MKLEISKSYKGSEDQISTFIKKFDLHGELLVGGTRNTLKLFHLNEIILNIKSFKIPNVINKVAYRFFRKSKAERSYIYARYLISKGIGTPLPIGFAEENTNFYFLRSFYICEHLESDLTYRTLVQNHDLHDWEGILRAFTRFTFSLHENGIEFLDHSPGNTLIQLNGGDYKFFLVDLNRMNFKDLNFNDRMKNFSRLTPQREMVEIMANEYSRFYHKSEEEVFEKMWFYTTDFQEKFRRKHDLKKRLKFWKKD